MALASGSRAVFTYVRERTRGETPAALSTAESVTGVVVTASGSNGTYTRGSGSWITAGIIEGQSVTVAGASNSVNNGTFEVVSVSATNLTLANSSATSETIAGASTYAIRLESLRATSRQIGLSKNILDSAEVRASGQRSDSRHGFIQITGSPGFQLSNEDFEDVMELALRNTFSTPTLSSPTTIEYTAVAASTNIVSADFVGVDLITEGLRPGDFVTIASMGAANNGRFRILTIALAGSDTEITMVPALDGAAPIVEAANGSATVAYTGRRLDLGNALTTWTVERQFQDIAKYQPFRGVGANSLQVNVSPESIITCVLTLLGLGSSNSDEGKLNGSTLATTTPVAASSNAPYAAFDGSMFEGGSEIALVTSFDFTVALNRSLEPVVGSKFSPDIFDGTAQVTGNMTVFLDDTASINDKFVDETESQLYFSAESADQSDFVNFVLPRVKYNGADIDPPQSGAVPQPTPFEALENTTYGTAVWIQVSTS